MITLSVNSDSKVKIILAYIVGAIGVIFIGFVPQLLELLGIASKVAILFVPILQVFSLILIIIVGFKKWKKHNSSQDSG